MKRFALLIVMVACLSLPAFAADGLSGDVFGGLSIDHRSNENSTLTYTGWQANVSFDVHKVIGLVGDFAGEYKKDEDGQVQYMFGPRFNGRKGKISYFGEALFGGDRIAGENFFAMGYGGGFNVQAGKIMIRLIQVDWVPVRLGNDLPWIKNNMRYGFGVVIPFGMRK